MGTNCRALLSGTQKTKGDYTAFVLLGKFFISLSVGRGTSELEANTIKILKCLENFCYLNKSSFSTNSSLLCHVNTSPAGLPQDSPVTQRHFLAVIILLRERNRGENILSILG